MIAAGIVMADLICKIAQRTPPLIDTLWDREIDARRAFHHNPTHQTLTAWVDAKEELENQS